MWFVHWVSLEENKGKLTKSLINFTEFEKIWQNNELIAAHLEKVGCHGYPVKTVEALMPIYANEATYIYLLYVPILQWNPTLPTWWNPPPTRERYCCCFWLLQNTPNKEMLSFCILIYFNMFQKFVSIVLQTAHKPISSLPAEASPPSPGTMSGDASVPIPYLTTHKHTK